MPVFAEQKETTYAEVESATSAFVADTLRSVLKESASSSNDSDPSSSSSSSSQQDTTLTLPTDDQPASSSSSPCSSDNQPLSPASTVSSSSSASSSNNNNQEEDLTSQPPSSPASPASACDKQDAATVVLEANELIVAEQSIIIFDWDDTLLASSFLASHGYRLDTDMETKEDYDFVKSELKQLEECIVNVFNEALPRGDVFVITNAETGWVELSAQKFLPGVLPYLSKITVISARSTYEHLHPDAPVKWKFCAMQDKLSPFFAKESFRHNVISFGDSHVEREAVRAVTRGTPNTRTKSIKFAECPSTEQLRKQLELVTTCFHYIHSHEGDLDLMLKMSLNN